MDVVKSPSKKNKFFDSKIKVISVIVLLLVLLVAYSKSTLGVVSVFRSDLLIEPVQQGDLEVVVDGYGTLISNKQQLLTALTRATVKEIVLKPGATVIASSVIVRLENPELQQLVNNAHQELAQSMANLRQLKLNNQREKLNEAAVLSEIRASYESASLKREAEEKLVVKGIVSSLTFKQTQLNERQLAERIDILTQRIDQLDLVQLEAVNIQKERIKQQQGQLNIAQSRLNALTIKAGFDGVLQRLNVELGQSLSAGQEVALIGSVTDLIALIRVPQSQAQQIQLGQITIIDTRRDKITGRVVRIDPIVENNTVNIEIALPKNLPASARPQLNVDGVIITDKLIDVLYIARPANVKTNSQHELYKFDENEQNALRQLVQFGQQAGRYIEIRTGAKLNDEFIISDLSNLRKTTTQLKVKF
ncbi:MAG: HlyD family efflux transporter periplasmic adaptor subunit [Colwellia sp.]|nr:HlyD family efflux transporter periplasmic adaptor subunit [Colwellia sp.]